jgi:DNA mismatch repair protein MutL
VFYNTPARLKFLKHPTTEASHITQCFISLSLAAQHVHMTLYLNDRVHMQAPVAATLGDRLDALFGQDFQHNLLPLASQEEAFQVHGLVAKATFHRANRRQQFFFVNGRLIQNRALSHALYEAYRTLLPRDRHPVACLFLTVAPGDVDVNVHPAKLEVRFRQESQLYDRLRRLLQQRLQESLSQVVVMPPVASPGMSAVPATHDSQEACRPVPMLWQAPTPLRSPTPSVAATFARSTPATPDLGLYAGYPEAGRSILTGMPLAQLHNTYILMQYAEGMFIIDQHAAHERIVYEQLRQRFSEGALESQQLLFPATLDLGAADPAWIEACLPRLANLGFILEPFGGHTYRLPSVPALLQARDYAAVLMDVLEVLRAPATEDVFEEGVPRVFHRLLTVMACHSAIRAGQRLQSEESRALVEELARVAMPFTCPHGRPVLLSVHMAEIEKKFLRC